MYSVDFLSGISLYFHWAELMNIEEKRIYEFDCIFSQLSILANVWQRLNISTKHISPDSDSKRCVLSENTYTTLYILARHDSPSGSALHDSRVNQDATGIKFLTGTGIYYFFLQEPDRNRY